MDKYNLGLVGMAIVWLGTGIWVYYSINFISMISFFVWAALLILYLFFVVPTSNNDVAKQINTPKTTNNQEDKKDV